MRPSPKQPVWQQLVCCVTVTTLEFAGCKLAPNRPENTEARIALDDTRYFSEPVHFKNLTVWPIHSKNPLKVGEYLTLKEAESKGLAVIREKGADASAHSGADEPRSRIQRNTIIRIDENANATAEPTNAAEEEAEAQTETESGTDEERQTVDTLELEDLQNIQYISTNFGGGATVNNIVVENLSKLPLLICAGTVVKGGNQDRQIGKDLVIAPGSTVNVASFCVEKGRWTPTREGSKTNGLFTCTEYVASSQVRLAAQYETNQQMVWSNVDTINMRAMKTPSTGTYLAASEKVGSESFATREEYERAVREHLEKATRHGETVGFAYAVNGEPVSVRTFANGDLLDQNLVSFLKAMSLEAELTLGGADTKKSAKKLTVAALEDMLTMVRRINEADETVAKTEASNRVGLRNNAIGGNSNCYVEIPEAVNAEAESVSRTAFLTLTQDWTRKTAE